MILIADSGSTKTDWRTIDSNGVIAQASTSGINPYYHNQEAIIDILRDELLSQVEDSVEEIHFYGAGCSSDENKVMVRRSLMEVFGEIRVNVDHDLTAAARSLCGKNPGIACILGTGANSCLYDGSKIVSNVPSLGYILGDEGSGAYLGKKLLSAYIQNRLPQIISDRFYKRFELSGTDLLNKIYKEKVGGRYLASFSKFIFQNIKDPYLYRLVYDSFLDFFDRNIVMYEDYLKQKVHFTGSVAFYYSNILRQVANDKGITIQNIIESPIAGLALYHQQNPNH